MEEDLQEDLNPYLAQALFVGRQSERANVTRRLRRGESVLLVGGRRCGKTSLVRRIEDLGRQVIQLDAGGWSVESETGAIAALGRGLDRSCTTREDLEAALKESEPLAIVIDEADRILHHEWAGNFLTYLRWIDGTLRRTRIAFLLAGGPELCGFRNPADGGSPPLNIAEPVYLEPLGYAARRELLAHLPKALDEEAVFNAAGGHPWLLTRLLDRLWDGADLETALESLFAASIVHLDSWTRQLGDEGIGLLRALPASGVGRAALRADPYWRRFRKAVVVARSLCLVDTSEDGERLLPRPAVFRDWLLASSDGHHANGHAVVNVADAGLMVFISYAREDEPFRRQLERHLSPLVRQGVISTWHDREIVPGADWQREIDSRLEAADLILLLVSEYFFHSDYCTGVELTRALERHASGTATAIPVVVKPVDLQGARFAHLQMLPTDGRAVTRWRNHAEAFTDVARGIRRAAEVRKASGGRP